MLLFEAKAGSLKSLTSAAMAFATPWDVLAVSAMYDSEAVEKASSDGLDLAKYAHNNNLIDLTECVVVQNKNGGRRITTYDQFAIDCIANGGQRIFVDRFVMLAPSGLSCANDALVSANVHENFTRAMTHFESSTPESYLVIESQSGCVAMIARTDKPNEVRIVQAFILAEKIKGYELIGRPYVLVEGVSSFASKFIMNKIDDIEASAENRLVESARYQLEQIASELSNHVKVNITRAVMNKDYFIACLDDWVETKSISWDFDHLEQFGVDIKQLKRIAHATNSEPLMALCELRKSCGLDETISLSFLELKGILTRAISFYASIAEMLEKMIGTSASYSFTGTSVSLSEFQFVDSSGKRRTVPTKPFELQLSLKGMIVDSILPAVFDTMGGAATKGGFNGSLFAILSRQSLADSIIIAPHMGEYSISSLWQLEGILSGDIEVGPVSDSTQFTHKPFPVRSYIWFTSRLTNRKTWHTLFSADEGVTVGQRSCYSHFMEVLQLFSTKKELLLQTEVGHAIRF